MNSQADRVLGIAMFWPITYVLLFAILVPALASVTSAHDKGWLVAVGITHVLTIVLSIGLLIYLLKSLWRSAGFSTGAKVLWTVALLALNPLAMPILFLLLRERDMRLANRGT